MPTFSTEVDNLNKFRHSKNPKVRSCFEKLMNEARRIELERLKSDPKITNKIPASVLDRLASGIGIGPSGESEAIGKTEANESSRDSEKVKLIGADVNQRRSSDKIDVIYDHDYTFLEAKKGYGITDIYDFRGRIFGNVKYKNYITHVLNYENGTESLIAILRKNASVKIFKSKNWKTYLKTVRKKYLNFKHLQVMKDGKIAKFSEITKEFEGCFLNIYFPFVTNKVIYKGKTIFEHDTSILVSLSIDLLNWQIKGYLYQPRGNPDPLEWVFKSGKHYVERLKGIRYSVVKVKNQKSTVVNLKGDKSTAGYLNSQKSTVVNLKGTNSYGEYLEDYYVDEEYMEKDELEEENLESDDFDENDSEGDGYLRENLKSDDFNYGILGYGFKPLGKAMDSSMHNYTEEMKKMLQSGINYGFFPNYPEIEFMELDIDRAGHDECIVYLYPNFRFYRAPENVLFNRILEDGKVIWEKEILEESIKEAYVFLDENEKWLVTVDNKNRIGFLQRSSNSHNWFDESRYMFDTRDLSVVKRNSEELSLMDLRFDFMGSFCIIPLGDPLSVSYRGEVYDLKEHAGGISVWFLYDFKNNIPSLFGLKYKIDNTIFVS